MGQTRQDGDQLLDATAIVCAEALRDAGQHGTIVIEAPVKNGKILWIEANFRRRVLVDSGPARR